MEIIIVVAVIAYFLIKEKYQVYKANKYADQMMKIRNEQKKS